MMVMIHEGDGDDDGDDGDDEKSRSLPPLLQVVQKHCRVEGAADKKGDFS